MLFFHFSYASVHGYVALLVCIFGSIANSLNIVVLTRREMRSPTNAILTGLAIADLFVMIDYIPYALLNGYTREEKLAYHWVW
jgi:ABC-type Fe3+-siderophore transport system permease subunit